MMKIYSLSGASGTGKSTSALQFAHEHNIPAIIDDGLLIVNGEKVAGTSAKFEKNTLKAVRRAIFEDESHKDEVIQALKNGQVDAILIIGTSDKMTGKIAKRLQLGEIMTYVHVEDVRTEKEIQMARFIREIQGKHVMPVPYRQVEQNFFKRLIQRGKEIFSTNREKIGETTIVRPDFHQQTITIARSVYLDVIKHVVEKNTIVSRLVHLHFSIVSVPRVVIEIQIAAPVSYYIPDAIKQLQQEIADSFQFHFSIGPEEINVKIVGIETTIR
ncbi:isopentenyl transferase family protein [Solibacillus sp. FSL R7-0682]|uniref:isopentenyl transferase family protein n=1 Tax=Solibacillus sp. FSL R7-0682 TaxID=2921690 RepID=UPI00404092EB